MKNVKEAWDAYDRIVLPDDASDVQRIETRRAFYAGAYAMLIGLQKIGESSLTEDQGVVVLAAWKQELERFQKMISRGQA